MTERARRRLPRRTASENFLFRATGFAIAARNRAFLTARPLDSAQYFGSPVCWRRCARASNSIMNSVPTGDAGGCFAAGSFRTRIARVMVRDLQVIGDDVLFGVRASTVLSLG
jgi:hypothetical protein